MGRTSLLCLIAATTTIGCAGRTGDIAPHCTLSVTDGQVIPDLGLAQGLFVHYGLAYFFGDAEAGVVHEYLVDARDEVRPTGRTVMLTQNGRDIVSHPQGLTHHPEIGTFIGERRGTIYRLDWPRALESGNLDQAVIHKVRASFRRSGGRPELVFVDGRWLIATGPYHVLPEDNHIELIDPRPIADGEHESVKIIDCSLCGTFIQSLHFDEANELLVLVQNTRLHRGWRLTFLDLPRSYEDGVAHIVSRLDVDLHDELEGYATLEDGRSIFLSNGKDGSGDRVRVGHLDCPVFVE